jgi:hypothetical protein
MVLDGASVISYDVYTSIWLAARSTSFYVTGRTTEFPSKKLRKYPNIDPLLKGFLQSVYSYFSVAFCFLYGEKASTTYIGFYSHQV